MSKSITIRFDPEVAALVDARARKSGVSFNQAVQDAVVRAEAADQDSVSDIAERHIATYRTVLDRLA
ncbi:MAG: toxin-antitoxin system HicB family antitoxin [Actinobacteria bacterium]|nr:toxin-antitoxin system HicB family antitoxin [Actinomycetota bacterium]